MMRTKYFLHFFLLMACPIALFAQQDRTAMEKERQELQKEIKEIQGAYNKVKGETKQNLSQLTLLNRKINLQEKYIGNINKELKIIDDDIYLSNIEIYRLTKQLDTLKEQYAKTIVYAYKHRSNYDYLNFIFSSANFNDAVRRVTYLKSYREYRAKQVSNILEHQQLITKRQQQQQGRKAQKKQVLDVQNVEHNELASQKKEKDQVVAKLKSKEKDFLKQIAAKQKRDRELKKNIDAIVARAIAKAQAEAKARAKKEEEDRKRALAEANTKPTTPSTTTTTPATNATGTAISKPKETAPKTSTDYLDLNANDKRINGGFANNKGSLPWPVDKGVVTLGFGIYKIEGLGPDLKDENPGLTISTDAGSPVKSVFEGTVASVFRMDDKANVVIQHGKYFTTYTNLASASVSMGATIARGQVIGTAGLNDDGDRGEIGFILMIGTTKVNPKVWLRP